MTNKVSFIVRYVPCKHVRAPGSSVEHSECIKCKNQISVKGDYCEHGSETTCKACRAPGPISTSILAEHFYNGPGLYRVTYYRHTRGRFVVKNSLASMLTGWRKRLNDPTAPTWQNCLIPHEFAGFRLERRQKYLGEVVEKNETTES